MTNIEPSELYNLVVDLKYKKRDARSFRYLVDRAVRRIHDNEVFPMTNSVRDMLEVYDIFPGEYMSRSEKQKYNTILKSNEVGDHIMIEHMYSVKKIINDLLKMELPDDFSVAVDHVKDYLVEKTHCVMKLTYAEKEMHG
jgi:hypothetical protein